MLEMWMQDSKQTAELADLHRSGSSCPRGAWEEQGYPLVLWM